MMGYCFLRFLKTIFYIPLNLSLLCCSCVLLFSRLHRHWLHGWDWHCIRIWMTIICEFVMLSNLTLTQIYCFHFICFRLYFSISVWVLPFNCDSHFIDGYGYWNDEPVMKQWMAIDVLNIAHSMPQWLYHWWAKHRNDITYYVLYIILYEFLLLYS